MVTPDTSTERVVQRVCIGVIAVGCLLSLLGPALYGEDQDRHLVKTLLLLGGDIEHLFIGLQASNGHRTLSGLFLGLLAPAMAVSGQPEWLWTYMDALVLLGALPLWHLARSLTTSTVAWLATAVYVISSGRIENSWLGIHSSVAVSFGAAWHLFLVRFATNSRARDGILLGALTFVVLSLHLSWLAMVPAAMLLIAWSRKNEWRILRPLSPALEPRIILSAGLLTLIVVPVTLQWNSTAWQSMAGNLVAGVGELAGLSSPMVRGGADWTYAPSAGAWSLIVVPVVVLGGWALIRFRQADGLRKNITDRQAATLKAWIVTVLTVQVVAAGLLVREWHLTPVNVWRYRHLTALVPPVAILTALGLLVTGNALARLWRSKRDTLFGSAVALVALATVHGAVLVGGYHDSQWRLHGVSIHADLREVVRATRDRWNYDATWFAASAFVEPGETPTMARPRWEYLTTWLLSGSDPARMSSSTDRVMYIVRAGGEFESLVLATQEVIDRVETSGYAVYLCQRRADRLLHAEPFFLTYGPRREGRHLLGPAASEPVGGSGKGIGDHSYALIAANVELPDVAGDVLSEVVVEGDSVGLIIGARLYGRDFVRRVAMNRIAGPAVIVYGAGGDAVRLDMRPDTLEKYVYLFAGDTLQNWIDADLERIELEFDSIITPANPWDGIPRRVHRGVRQQVY